MSDWKNPAKINLPQGVAEWWVNDTNGMFYMNYGGEQVTGATLEEVKKKALKADVTLEIPFCHFEIEWDGTGVDRHRIYTYVEFVATKIHQSTHSVMVRRRDAKGMLDKSFQYSGGGSEGPFNPLTPAQRVQFISLKQIEARVHQALNAFDTQHSIRLKDALRAAFQKKTGISFEEKT